MERGPPGEKLFSEEGQGSAATMPVTHTEGMSGRKIGPQAELERDTWELPVDRRWGPGRHLHPDLPDSECAASYPTRRKAKCI